VLTLRDYADHVADVCLSREPPRADLDALGGEPRRWLRYRRMVRRRLSDIVRAAFPRFLDALGETSFAALEDAFFEARMLASPLIRDVPGELLAFLEGRGARETVGLPAHVMDLARLEWAERAVAYDEDDLDDAGALAMENPVVLTRAHRLLSLEHAVHVVDEGAPVTPERRATTLCVYRDAETHTVRVLHTTPAAHALLEELSSAKVCLREGVERAAARTGAVVDLPFIEAVSDLLADFSSRGIVRGARAESS